MYLNQFTSRYQTLRNTLNILVNTQGRMYSNSENTEISIAHTKSTKTEILKFILC
jgi:hypothetical protein